MGKPVEIQLKYRDDGNNIITMFVDPMENVSYKWQFCKAKTADWETINTMDKNTHTITNPINGDKYRCLVIVSNKVCSYSKTLTIGQNKFHSKDEYKSQNQYSYQRFYSSVQDTDGMDGLEFEKFCANVLKENGFCDVKVTQGSGDYGIDILAKKDTITYAIQCKCYKEPVGNKAVQEAYSGKTFYNCMVAVVLTNNYFTQAAIETAKRNTVVLWNRDYLDSMIRNMDSQDSMNRGAEQKERAHREQRQYEKEHQERREEKSVEPDFFKGCSSWEQIKERHRKLMQMYHPDYETGDVEYAKLINNQYSKLKEKYNQ